MPLRTKSNSRKSRSFRSKSKSRSMKSKSRSIKSKSRSMKSKSRTKSYKRKYRGGCGDKACETTGSAGSGASSTGDFWTSGPMLGGASPEQISNDTFSHVTDKVFYSSA